MTGARDLFLARLLAIVGSGALLLVGCDGDDGAEPAPGTTRSEPGTPTTAVDSGEPTTSGAPLPLPRTEVAGTAWNGRIVVVGGLTEDGGVADRADVWDPSTDTWNPLPELPLPLHHTAVVSSAGRVWVIGGYTTAAGRWRAVDSVFSLGDGEGSWREEAPLGTARGALAAAAIDDGIVVGGGVGPDGAVLASTEIFTAGRGSWSAGPDMATAREHFAMAGIGPEVFAISGRAGGLDTNIDSVEVLRDGSWRPAGSVDRARGGIGAAVVEGVPCVAGGEEPGGTIAEVECLRDGGWEVVDRLEQPRHGLAVVALGGRLHVVSGGPQPGLTVSDAHEVLALE